ncbi:MAG: ABC transporter substrate-binding protein [Phycisphaeraceae bacterium]
MKYLFAVTAAILVVVSLGVYYSYPDLHTDRPVIYWVTDNNSARQEQIELFGEWLVENGHVTEDGRPAIELRLEIDPTAGTDASQKKIINGVSGVLGDVIDTGAIRYYVALGLLTDVTEMAQEYGFDFSNTYAAIQPDLLDIQPRIETVTDAEGGEVEQVVGTAERQYAFPCNIWVDMVWVNKDTFARYGMEPPPTRWTIEEFEEIGREFVRRANEGKSRRDVFFVGDEVPLMQLVRTMGSSVFNETLTRPDVNNEIFIGALQRKYRWMYEDHLIPSLAERQSFATSGSARRGGAEQLLVDGNYAMLRRGRYGIINLRRFQDPENPLDLAVVEPPYQEMPTTLTGTRSAGIYTQSESKQDAAKFLAYLASEKYNMQIVRDGDAMPPNPEFAQTEEFLRPPEHPNEWGTHAMFNHGLKNLAVPFERSPFLLHQTVAQRMTEAEDKVLNKLITPEAAAAELQRRLERELERTLEEYPQRRQWHEKLLKDQETIDRLRAEGKKVPLELIQNPYWRAYYQHKGWAE